MPTMHRPLLGANPLTSWKQTSPIHCSRHFRPFPTKPLQFDAVTFKPQNPSFSSCFTKPKYDHLKLRLKCLTSSSSSVSQSEAVKVPDQLGNIFIEKLLNALKVLKTPALAAVLLSLLLTFKPNSAWAASGGRIGGSSFSSRRSSSSSSSTSSSSSSSSPRPSSSSSSSSSTRLSPSSSSSPSPSPRRSPSYSSPLYSSSPSPSTRRSSTSPRPSTSQSPSPRPTPSYSSSPSPSPRPSPSYSSPTSYSSSPSPSTRPLPSPRASPSPSPSPSTRPASLYSSPRLSSKSSSSTIKEEHNQTKSSSSSPSPSIKVENNHTESSYSSSSPSSIKDEEHNQTKSSYSSLSSSSIKEEHSHTKSSSHDQTKSSSSSSSFTEEEHDQTNSSSSSSPSASIGECIIGLLASLATVLCIAYIDVFFTLIISLIYTIVMTLSRLVMKCVKGLSTLTCKCQSALKETSNVVKLQICLLGSARTLQKELDRIAETADTSTPEGLSYVMTEATVALLRHPDYWISSYSSVTPIRNIDDAEKCFTKSSIEERAKFDEETLVNVDNKRRKDSSSKKDGHRNEYIVVTMLVALEGKYRLPTINESVDLKKALQDLGSIPPKNILAVEILWTPQQENDTLSEEELMEDYPLLKSLWL